VGGGFFRCSSWLSRGRSPDNGAVISNETFVPSLLLASIVLAGRRCVPASSHQGCAEGDTWEVLQPRQERILTEILSSEGSGRHLSGAPERPATTRCPGWGLSHQHQGERCDHLPARRLRVSHVQSFASATLHRSWGASVLGSCAWSRL